VCDRASATDINAAGDVAEVRGERGRVQGVDRADQNFGGNADGGGEGDGDFPRTSWTRIVHARDPVSPECRPSLARLAELYDRPLLGLFQRRLSGPCRSHAEDWKQDFVASRLLSGKLFATLKPASRFRGYLAAAVRNYINDCLASRKALREVTLTVEPVASADEDELILSRERALDCVRQAGERLVEWAARGGNEERLAYAKALRDQTVDLTRPPPTGSPKRQVVEQFKNLLRVSVREEMLVEPGTDEQMVLDREAAILVRAVSRRRGGS
jgi:hypothetical protein